MNTALVVTNNDSDAVVGVRDLKQKLQSASSIEDVKGVVDKAAALLKYAKQAKRSRGEQNHWAVIRLLAESSCRSQQGGAGLEADEAEDGAVAA